VRAKVEKELREKQAEIEARLRRERDEEIEAVVRRSDLRIN
jgi:hypothetical protein